MHRQNSFSFIHHFNIFFTPVLTDCCYCYSFGTGGAGKLGKQHSQCLCSCICASSRQDRNTSFITRGDLSFGKNHRVGKHSHITIFICFFCRVYFFFMPMKRFKRRSKSSSRLQHLTIIWYRKSSPFHTSCFFDGFIRRFRSL